MRDYADAGQDSGAAKSFVISYAPGCLDALPWGDEKFDCLIIRLQDDYLMEEAVDELLSKNCVWVHTAGEDAEHWHDYIDRRSVELGRQTAVGDGNPRTAWHEELNSLLEMKLSLNFGGNAYFLIVLVGLAEFQGFLETLKTINEERFQKTLGSAGVKRSLPPGGLVQ
jgi:hypothetical protein